MRHIPAHLATLSILFLRCDFNDIASPEHRCFEGVVVGGSVVPIPYR